MRAKRKICIVTGTRAEYGLLHWLMKEVAADEELELQIVATGMHLSPEFGLTFQQIEADGFTIDERIETLLSSDSPVGIAKSIGLGVIGFGEAYNRLRPDVVVVFGDRFETLAAAQAAMVVPIVLAHIGGGDIAEATYDNSIRHAITKMAHLHFVTHAKAARRVEQLGENPEHIFNVGSLAVDSTRNFQWLTRESLESALGIRLPERPVLVTYHPTTTDVVDSEREFGELLGALELLMKDGYSPVFTAPNCDNNSRRIRERLDTFVASHPAALLFESLGVLRYLSLMRLSAVVMGNSSSGLYEAPLLSVPSVDIGNRQRGRERGSSVHSVSGAAREIYAATRRAIERPGSFSDYPYQGTGQSVAGAIKTVLKEISLDGLTYKKFRDRTA